MLAHPLAIGTVVTSPVGESVTIIEVQTYAHLDDIWYAVEYAAGVYFHSSELDRFAAGATFNSLIFIPF